MSAGGFLIGAVQSAGPARPREANPCARGFDIDALDAWVEAVTAHRLGMFDRAGRKGLDLVLGTEDLQNVSGLAPVPHRPSLLGRYAQTIPGPLAERIGAVARKRDMHIGACFLERDGGAFHNTAVLFDGKGRIVGKYRKVHLPPQEACVLTPGRSFPVFATELGGVGFLICYDVKFPEAARCLALNGADLLLHPTIGYGWTERVADVTIAARAVDNSVPVVIACGRRSGVVSAWGERLADAKQRSDAIVAARLDPRRRRRFSPGHWRCKAYGFTEVLRQQAQERVPRAYRALTADVPPILADSARPVEIYTRRRKTLIRKLIADCHKAIAQGRPEPIHWNARAPHSTET